MPGSAHPSFLSGGPDGSRRPTPRAIRHLRARALEPVAQLSNALANLLMNQSASRASTFPGSRAGSTAAVFLRLHTCVFLLGPQVISATLARRDPQRFLGLIRALPTAASRCFRHGREPRVFLIASGHGRWLRDSRELQGLRSGRRLRAWRPSPFRLLSRNHAAFASRRAWARSLRVSSALCPSIDSGTTMTGRCLRAGNL